MHLWAPGGNNIQWGKDSLFNKCRWENCKATCKRMKLEHFLRTYTKINSKWIKDLNVRPETIKVLRGKHRQNTWWHKSTKILYDPPPKVTEIKTKASKWDLIKLKSFCTAKEAQIYNEAKTTSSIPDAGKTGQLHVKEWNLKIGRAHVWTPVT